MTPQKNRPPPSTWRHWFAEWRRAARYVAIRKLLQPQLKCGIFRHSKSGELYYELAETSCVTRGGKFYVHPAQLPRHEVDRAEALIVNAMRGPTPNDDPRTPNGTPDMATALSSWRKLKRKTSGDAGSPSSGGGVGGEDAAAGGGAVTRLAATTTR